MTTAERKRIDPLTRSNLPGAVWSVTVPIRFRHCDPAGIVFTPRYFDILNEAVEQFFGAALGLDYYRLVSERKIGLGYAHASCEFLKPSRMGEVLDVAVLVDRIGGSSYTLVLPVFKDGVEVVRGRLVTVTTMLEAFTSCPIPDDIRAALQGYRDKCGDAMAEPPRDQPHDLSKTKRDTSCNQNRDAPPMSENRCSPQSG